MIKHIVFFRIKSADKEEELHILKDKIEKLKTEISSVSSIEAGINISPREAAWDIALVSEFKDNDALQTYSVHPKHMELIEYLKKLDRDIAVVDYEF